MGIPRALALVAVLCAAAAPASALTEDEERAKAHFLAGQSYYDQAAYTDALKEFNEAFRISKRPALLYNIARCYEALEQLDKAVDNLQQYLQMAPQAEDRDAVQSRIKNLQERIQATSDASRRRPIVAEPNPKPPMAPTDAPPPVPGMTTTTTPPPVAAPPPRHRTWTWIVGGAGVGILGAALGTGIASQLSYSDLTQKCMNDVCSPSASGQIDGGKRLALATDILWPIGAAAVVTSIVLFVVEGRRSHARAAIRPAGTLSTAGVAFAHSL